MSALGRATTLLRYSQTRSTFWVLGLVMTFSLALAGLIGAFGKVSSSVPLTFVAAANIFVIWMIAVARIASPVMDAHSLRIPGLQHDAAFAFALAGVLSVALPALLVYLCLAVPAGALLWLPLAAVAALFLAWLPRMVLAGAGLLPLMASLLKPRHGSWIGELFAQPPGMVVGACLALALACLWRWRQLTRQQPRSDDVWWQPALLRLDAPELTYKHLAESSEAARLQWQHPRWTHQPAAAPFGLQHGQRVATMRAWLGSPFSPSKPAEFLRKLPGLLLGLFGFPLLFGLLLLHDGRPPQWLALVTMVWLGVFGVTLLATTFMTQLQYRRQRTDGIWMELALVPGWGNALQARRLLLRATLGTVCSLCAGLLAMLLLLHCLFPVARPWLGAAAIALGMGGAALCTLCGMAWVLARGRITPFIWAPYMVLGMAVMGSVVAWQRVEQFTLPLRPTLAVGSVMLVIALVSGITAWRRLQRLPHPFLQE